MSEVLDRAGAKLADKLYIDGCAVAGQGERICVINPGTEEVLAEVAGASEAQIDEAVAAARRAYDSGVWSGLPATERAAALRGSSFAKSAYFPTTRVGSSVQNAACSTSIGSRPRVSATGCAAAHNRVSSWRDVSG